MLWLSRTAACAAVLFTMTGCSDDEPGDLFDAQDPPTPNVLRGTYKVNVDEPGASIEVRLRFEEEKITGAVRCTSKADGKLLEAGGSVPLATDINAPTGEFTIEALVLEKNEPPFYCQAGLRAGTYQFKVEELKLTLTNPTILTPLIYGKVGD